MSGKRGRRTIDLTGQRFGRLVVIGVVSRDKKAHQTKWNCHCDCGKNVEVAGGNLKNGHSQSCGCFSRDASIERATTHGRSHTRLFRIWAGMHTRCNNKNFPRYPSYGGRGITVTPEWKDFIVFETWALLNGYNDNLTIDRIDNDGNYCPENCRWVDNIVQQNNKQNNHFITVNGETHTATEWARIKGLNDTAIHVRIKRGWKPEEAVNGKGVKV